MTISRRQESASRTLGRQQATRTGTSISAIQPKLNLLLGGERVYSGDTFNEGMSRK